MLFSTTEPAVILSKDIAVSPFLGAPATSKRVNISSLAEQQSWRAARRGRLGHVGAPGAQIDRLIFYGHAESKKSFEKDNTGVTSHVCLLGWKLEIVLGTGFPLIPEETIWLCGCLKIVTGGFPGATVVMNLLANAGDKRPLQVAVRLCILLYSMVQSTTVQYLYFKPRMSRSKCKSSGDIAGTTVLFKDSLMKKLIKYNPKYEFTTLEPSGQLNIDFKSNRKPKASKQIAHLLGEENLASGIECGQRKRVTLQGINPSRYHLTHVVKVGITSDNSG
ncbi:hypothetical protein MG293_000904 [Ovis ammon polii]|uniref:Uncharacterized protein n=1 Tax=Ovis ammon polii TaxID=230172 RepID=A0AAD4YHJ1_OVIAM|nr:hypothetical protein MG293_000904 [Ovis ammon polii]